MDPFKDEDWKTREQAAQYLTDIGCPISLRTLANLASNNNAGRGPPFTRYRWNRVRYFRPDLDQWAKEQRVRVA
jgi:hypothetical protein